MRSSPATKVGRSERLPVLFRRPQRSEPGLVCAVRGERPRVVHPPGHGRDNDEKTVTIKERVSGANPLTGERWSCHFFAIEGMTGEELSQALEIEPSPSGYNIYQFPAPEEGLASPVSFSNPNFVGGVLLAAVRPSSLYQMAQFQPGPA
jgi:hypothetical protein